MLCKYKNALGEPGKGVHSYRVFDIAVVDVVLTILLGYGVSWVLNTSFLWTLIAVFLIGIVVHWIFCVDTTIGKKINHWFIKL